MDLASGLAAIQGAMTFLKTISSGLKTGKEIDQKLALLCVREQRWENKKTKPSPLAIQKLQKLLFALKKKKNVLLDAKEIEANNAPQQEASV